MAITEAFFGTATIGATEISLLSGTTTLQFNATAGIYQLYLGLQNMAAGDGYRLRIKEKVLATSAQLLGQPIDFSGAQLAPLYISVPLTLMRGFDITLVLRGGAARSIDWSIRQVA